MADTAVLDPIATSAQPETLQPISPGSFIGTTPAEQAKQQKINLQRAENRRRNIQDELNDMLAAPGTPHQEFIQDITLPPQPNIHERNAVVNVVRDAVSELPGAVTEFAGEKIVEAAGSVRTLSMEAIKKGGMLILFMGADLARQAQGKELQNGSQDEAAQHAEAPKLAVHQTEGITGFFRDIGAEAEVQTNLPDIFGLQAENKAVAHSEDKHGNELNTDGNKIAVLMQQLASLARKRVEEPMEIARAETGVASNKEENELLGIKSLDYAKEHKSNTSAAFALFMGRLAEIETRKQVDSGSGALENTGKKTKQGDVGAKNLKNASTHTNDTMATSNVA